LKSLKVSVLRTGLEWWVRDGEQWVKKSWTCQRECWVGYRIWKSEVLIRVHHLIIKGTCNGVAVGVDFLGYPPALLPLSTLKRRSTAHDKCI
jgi:hypothetical protein